MQKRDKAAIHLSLQDVGFKEQFLQPREAAIAEHFSKRAGALCRPKSGLREPANATVEEIATRAMTLKLLLLLSPQDYRIQYCPPGTDFDPLRMQAYDENNQPVDDTDAANREVKLCLFSALLMQKPKPFAFAAKIDAALVKNKVLLASYEETILEGAAITEPSTCVCKAVVLLGSGESATEGAE